MEEFINLLKKDNFLEREKVKFCLYSKEADVLHFQRDGVHILIYEDSMKIDMEGIRADEARYHTIYQGEIPSIEEWEILKKLLKL